jgi:hypothetical protein
MLFRLGSKGNVLRIDGTKVDRPAQNALHQHGMHTLAWHAAGCDTRQLVDIN